MHTMESDNHKGRPPSPQSTPKGCKSQKQGLTAKICHKLPMILFFTTLIGFSAWTVILYSYRLLRLQERVDTLEGKCQMNDLVIQKYLDDHLEQLVEQVKFSWEDLKIAINIIHI